MGKCGPGKKCPCKGPKPHCKIGRINFINKKAKEVRGGGSWKEAVKKAGTIYKNTK